MCAEVTPTKMFRLSSLSQCQKAHFLESTLLFASLVLAIGCGQKTRKSADRNPSVASTDSTNFLSINNPWVLSSPNWDSFNPPVLAKDNIGIRIGPMGDGISPSAGQSIEAQSQKVGILINREPMYQGNRYTKDQKIVEGFSPLGVEIYVNSQKVPMAETYQQSLDLRTGIFTTQIPFKLANLKGEVVVQTAIDQGRVAALWTIHAPPKTQILWKPTTENRTEENVANKGFHVVQQVITVSNRSQDKLSEVRITVPSNGIAKVGESFAIDTEKSLISRHFSPLSKSKDTIPEPPETVLKSCAQDLERQWKTSIEIDGPIQDQAVVHSFLYYLRNGEGDAISPMGLTSSHYDGHVFWDADTWIAPALYFLSPAFVTKFADYRLSLVQAPPAQPFPWESAVNGTEQTTVMNKEIHICGDVLWGLSRENALGLIPTIAENRYNQVSNWVSQFYLQRATKNPDGTYSLNDVVSPDENHVGNNDLYTNLLAQWAVNGESWGNRKIKFRLPKDKKSFLNYENDRLRNYKQDAGLLAIYPLQFGPAEAQADIMMKRFAGKEIKNGPAMSMSVNALIEARLGHPNTAYQLWESSWKAYMRSQFLLFSEKAHNGQTYFMTGAAGCLQTVLYGFIGLRIDDHKPKDLGKWSVPLKNGFWLTCHPHLPNKWKSVTLRHFYVLNKAYTLVISRTSHGDSVLVTQN